MLTMKQLQRSTTEFLTRHWDRAKLGNAEAPGWSAKPYHFRGLIPNGTSRGCYALLEGHEVVYIGLGARRGSGRYKGHGINARLKKYLRKDKRNKSASEDQPRVRVKKWAKLTAIYTIGFPEKYSYLAHALEDFLLYELSPRRNKNQTNS